jgi:hypothetical protein
MVGKWRARCPILEGWPGRTLRRTATWCSSQGEGCPSRGGGKFRRWKALRAGKRTGSTRGLAEKPARLWLGTASHRHLQTYPRSIADRKGTRQSSAVYEPARSRLVLCVGEKSLHRRHRSVEFRKFLDGVEAQVPAALDVHLHHGQTTAPIKQRLSGKWFRTL